MKWNFKATSVTINRAKYDVKYSICKDASVFAFAMVDGVAIRIHITPDMTYYADAYKAATAAESAKAEPVKAEPAKAEPVKAEPVKAEPAKAEPAKAEPAKAEPVKAEPVKAEPVKAEPAKAEPAKAEPVKDWRGTSIKGKGFEVKFDIALDRTRVIFTDGANNAQKDICAKMGFYWSNVMQSFNKKLTDRARRAAIELAAALNAL